MTPQRHDLVRLSADAWHEVLARTWDTPARQCLTHWATRDLPLVVAMQTASSGDAGCGDMLALGLAAPLRWGRRRIALRVRATQVNDAGSFPDMAAVSRWFAPSLSAPWAELQRALAAQGIVTTVFGSHGWQQMTGLAYLHKDSDLDLLMQVADPTTADRAAGLLSACGFVHPRLDGELLFPFGHVAWREWQRWRNGLTASILVKHRSRAVLEHGEGWLAAARTTGPLAP